jgi:hypothetical protein
VHKTEHDHYNELQNSTKVTEQTELHVIRSHYNNRTAGTFGQGSVKGNTESPLRNLVGNVYLKDRQGERRMIFKVDIRVTGEDGRCTAWLSIVSNGGFGINGVETSSSITREYYD